MMALRNLAWHTFSRCPTSENWEFYRLLRNQCTSLKRNDQFLYQQQLTLRLLDNPELLYKEINARRKVKTGIPSLKTPSGLSTSPEEVARTLGAQYAPIFRAAPKSVVILAPVSPVPSLSSIIFSRDAVYHKLTHLRQNSSPGIDHIHPKALNAVAAYISNDLALYFQRSLDSAEVPQTWKQGLITPVFKGGDRTLPANYRPVTLLSVISKVMESIIADTITRHLEENHILAHEQHGFRPGHSCLSNLLLARDDWTKAVDCRVAVDVAYLDFSKAFDRVDHLILIQKLRHYGIDDPLLTWISRFLQDRTSCVRVKDAYSDCFPVTSGVPQGSVLGPTLFLIFINDISMILSSSFLLFADDLKVWRRISSFEDHQILQRDLDRLYQWSLEHNLPFNSEKCHILTIRHSVRYAYHLGDELLRHVDQVSDLGVIVQHDLGCSSQCNKAARTANHSVGLLRRLFRRFDRRLFPQLLSAYIRPPLEYAVSAWHPWLQQDMHALEQPQRRATKLINGLQNMSYEERLQYSGLFSIRYRLLRGDLLLTFRILTENHHPCKSLMPLSNRRTHRGHNLKIAHQNSRLNSRRYFLPLRICRVWNALPPEVVHAESLSSFKQRLDEHLWQSTFK